MNVFSATVIVLVLTVCLAVIKQIRPEYAVIASCVVGLGFVTLALSSVYPLFEYIKSFEFLDENSQYFKAVMKALGVALLCSIASEICKDFGENALAFGIEIFCKCEIIVMSLPLITGVLELARDMLAE